MWCNTPCIIFKFCNKCSFGREGPQLGVDAYGVRRYGSVIQVCEQPCATLTLQAFAKTNILGRRF